MSFSLSEVAQDFDWPVEFKMPASHGGFTTKRFTARFAIMDTEQADSYSSIGSNAEDVDFARRVLVGWDENDVLDDQGRPLPFSPAARDALIAIPYIRGGIISSYCDAMRGEARTKN